MAWLNGTLEEQLEHEKKWRVTAEESNAILKKQLGEALRRQMMNEGVWPALRANLDRLEEENEHLLAVIKAGEAARDARNARRRKKRSRAR